VASPLCAEPETIMMTTQTQTNNARFIDLKKSR
jgi:hypothetical protein